MAKAYKCDICGCFYTDIKIQTYNVIGPVRRVDMCDDCYLKLVKLINDREEEEQMKNAGTN